MQYMKDCIKKLPLLEGAKMIVIDEGLDAMYARVLIAGWIHTWTEKAPNYSIGLLSFSDPKFWYSNEPELLTSVNIDLHDYYSINIDEVAGKENHEHVLQTIAIKSYNTVIIDCLSSLVLYTSLTKTLQFIEKLNTKVSQLICIYRRDFIQNKIPAIDTLGTTYIKLEKFDGISSINDLVYIAKLVHRKLAGSVICQTEVISQNNTTFQINSEKIIPNTYKLEQLNTNQSVKIESSFRIEMSAQEMEQRNKTPLPYTSNVTNISKIHYQLDDVDDIDEDDPDDDLDF